MIQIVHSANFLHYTMQKHYPEVAFTIICIHLFVDRIMCIKPIFTKNEHYRYFESKIEIGNTSVYYQGIHTLIIHFLNINKKKLDFQGFQQSSILTDTNSFSYTPLLSDLSVMEQMHLTTNIPVHFTRLSLPFHISSQAHHTIFHN